MFKPLKPLKKFHSQAQREKCLKLLEDKVITQAQYDEMSRNSGPHHRLPERVKPK